MRNNTRHNLLLCYDIRESRRLQRIHRCVRRYGMPLQYSVFYCQLTDATLGKLTDKLRRLMDETADDIRIYRIQTRDDIIFIGRRPLPDGISLLGDNIFDQPNR